MTRRMLLSSVLAASAVASIATAVPANAVAYSMAQVCGSNYALRYTYNVQHKNADGTYDQLGVIFLGYNSGNGYNCAYTEKFTSEGTATHVGVKLRAEGDSDWISNSGSFKYYAGPVYRYALDRCVQVSGDITTSQGVSGSYTSDLVACG